MFYKDWSDAIRELPNEVRLEVYDSIVEYALSGRVPQLKPLAGVAFNFIRPQIDRNNKKYENGCKGAEYGKLGGRPRKTETPQKPQQNPNKTPNEKEYGNANEPANEHEPAIPAPSGAGNGELPDGNSSGSFSFQPTKKTRARGNAATRFETARYGEFEPAVRRWLDYKAEIRDGYRSQASVDTMARNLWALAGKQPAVAMQIVEQSIGNNWKGLFELKNGTENHPDGRDDASADYRADILRRMGAM